MNIKEIRKLTGLSQKNVFKKYHIPIDTIKGWEADGSSIRSRKCPSYVLELLEFKVKADINKSLLDKTNV